MPPLTVADSTSPVARAEALGIPTTATFRHCLNSTGARPFLVIGQIESTAGCCRFQVTKKRLICTISWNRRQCIAFMYTCMNCGMQSGSPCTVPHTGDSLLNRFDWQTWDSTICRYSHCSSLACCCYRRAFNEEVYHKPDKPQPFGALTVSHRHCEALVLVYDCHWHIPPCTAASMICDACYVA